MKNLNNLRRSLISTLVCTSMVMPLNANATQPQFAEVGVAGVSQIYQSFLNVVTVERNTPSRNSQNTPPVTLTDAELTARFNAAKLEVNKDRARRGIPALPTTATAENADQINAEIYNQMAKKINEERAAKNEGLLKYAPLNNVNSGYVEINGAANPLLNLPAVASGPYDRSYNGVELAGEPSTMTEEEYNRKSMVMLSILWGIAEVGEKLCKPVGTIHPPSLEKWWMVVKNNVAAEKIRDAVLKSRTEFLRGEGDKIIAAQRAGTADIQLKSLEFQIEGVNLTLDSLSGSTLYGLDNEGAKASATARIPWREAMLVAAFQGSADNKAENLANSTVYNACVNGTNASIGAANGGCARTKIVQTCDEKNVCSSVTVPDPVPGSCEMASALVPAFQSGALSDLAKIYLTTPIPSKSINGRIVYLGEVIGQTIASFPVSSDSKYDWTTPLAPCLDTPMMVTVRNNGLICPSDTPDASYDKAKVDAIANIAAGYKIDSNTVDACIATITANKAVAEKRCAEISNFTPTSTGACTDADDSGCGQGYDNVIRMQKAQNASAEPSCRMAKENFPAMLNGALAEMKTLVSAPVTKESVDRLNVLSNMINFHTNGLHKPDEGHDWKANLASCLKAPMVVTSTTAPSANVATIETKAAEVYKLPAVMDISASARAFLTAMGVQPSALDATTAGFKSNWNEIDLRIGQPMGRDFYFKFVQDLLAQLIEADKTKVATLLAQRDRMLIHYEQTKRTLQPTLAAGSTTTNRVGAQSGASSSSGTNGSSTVTINNQAGQSAPALGSEVRTGSAPSTSGLSSSATSRTTQPGSSRLSSLGGAGIGSGGNGSGRYAISSNAQKKIDSIKSEESKIQAKANKITNSLSQPKNAESKLVASISKGMNSSFNDAFMKANGNALGTAVNGGGGAYSSYEEPKKSSTTATYGYDGQGYNGGSGSLGGNTGRAVGKTNFTAPGAGAKGAAANSAAPTAGSGATASAASGTSMFINGTNQKAQPAVYNELFDQISRRYETTGRARLGLDKLQEVAP